MIDMPDILARKPSPMQDDRARKTRKKINGMNNRRDKRIKTFIVTYRIVCQVEETQWWSDSMCACSSGWTLVLSSSLGS